MKRAMATATKKRKRRRNSKAPSPAQLAARAKFTEMVRAKAAARAKVGGGPKPKANRRKKRNGLLSSLKRAFKTKMHSPRKRAGRKKTQQYFTVEGPRGRTYKVKATSEKAALRMARSLTPKRDFETGLKRFTTRNPKRKKRNLSPKQRRTRAMTRASRQRIVAYRQHGTRAKAQRRRLPNPRPQFTKGFTRE